MAQIDSLAMGPGNISMIKVASNSTGKQFDISGDPTAKSSAWPIELLYYESIFQDVVHASVTYVDTGDNQQLGNKPAVVGLPITGSESVKLKFEDVSGEKLEVELLVNKVTEVLSDAGKSLVTLEMNSKELFDNDKVRINTRFDGAVSDHVKKMLEVIFGGTRGRHSSSSTKSPSLSRHGAPFIAGSAGLGILNGPPQVLPLSSDT